MHFVMFGINSERRHFRAVHIFAYNSRSSKVHENIYSVKTTITMTDRGNR